MVGAVNAAFDILTFGAIIVLVALGLVVIASMMGVFNFAHGEFILLGAYTVYLAHVSGVPTWAGMIAAPFLVGLVGVVLERSVVRRFYGAPLVGMLGTFAIGLVIREIVRGLIGGLQLMAPEPWPGAFIVGDFNFSKWRSVILFVTIAIVGGAYLALKGTKLGLMVRASLENPSLARATGIRTDLVYMMTFAVGAGLAGLAGALIVPIFGLTADLGVRFLIQGFLAIMLGGAGSFEGPAIGAGLIGMLGAGLPWFVAPVFAELLVFVIAIAIVKLKPEGLLSNTRG